MSNVLTLEPTFFLKDDDPFIIAGYASIDITDKDNERVSLPALRESFERMMRKQSRRNLMLHHSNVQIGELLWEYTDSSGRLWKAGVDDIGLFVIAQLFNDTKTGRDAIGAMKTGNLLSFSIGGRKLDSEIRCERGHCFNEIVKLDLHEITSCQAGKNPEAKAFILKGEPIATAGLCTSCSTCQLEFSAKAQTSPFNRDNPYKPNNNLLDNTDKKEEKRKMDPTEDIAKLKDAIEGLTALVKDLNEEIKAAKKKPKEYYYYNKPKKEEFKDAAEENDAWAIFNSDEAEKARKKKVEEEEEEKLETTAKDLGVADVDKASYKQFMSQCMKEGKDMAACAAEYKKKTDEDAEKAKKKKNYYYYKYPKKEDFDSEDEFKAAEQEYNALKASIVKELGLPDAGTVIKKSAKSPKEQSAEFDIKKLEEKVKISTSLRDLLKEEES